MHKSQYCFVLFQGCTGKALCRASGRRGQQAALVRIQCVCYSPPAYSFPYHDTVPLLLKVLLHGRFPCEDCCCWAWQIRILGGCVLCARLAYQRSSASGALAAGGDALQLQSRVQLLDEGYAGQYMIGDPLHAPT